MPSQSPRVRRLLLFLLIVATQEHRQIDFVGCLRLVARCGCESAKERVDEILVVPARLAGAGGQERGQVRRLVGRQLTCLLEERVVLEFRPAQPLERFAGKSLFGGPARPLSSGGDVGRRTRPSPRARAG